jgi:AraC-like DNA-binding protein
MWTVAIASAGAALSVALALALWLRDRRHTTATVSLVGACVAVGINLLDDALLASGAYQAAPWALGPAYMALAWIAPLVWFHMLALIDPEAASPARWRRHASGAVLVCLVLAPYLLSSPDVRLALERDEPIEGLNRLVPALASVAFFLTTFVQQGVYLVDGARRVLGVADCAPRRAAMAVLTAAAGAWLSLLAALGLELSGRGGLGADLGVFGLVVAVYVLAIRAIARPPDPLEAPPEARGPKYARSSLEPADLDRLDARLTDLVSSQSIHRDPTLSLRKLARVMGAGPNDLSQLLNTRRGGFHAWLNAARIEDVKVLLAAPDRAFDSIADLGFEVGFNAKSTFYDAFRRHVGKTPAQWRAKAGYSPSNRAVDR